VPPCCARYFLFLPLAAFLSGTKVRALPRLAKLISRPAFSYVESNDEAFSGGWYKHGRRSGTEAVAGRVPGSGCAVVIDGSR